jgi:hypothetical protein
MDGTTAIQKQLQAALSEFKTQDFYKCLQQWREIFSHSIKSQGKYFEEDSVE